MLVNPASRSDSSRTRRAAGPRSRWPAHAPAGLHTGPPRLDAVLAGRVEGTLGRVEAVTGGIERAFR